MGRFAELFQRKRQTGQHLSRLQYLQAAIPTTIMGLGFATVALSMILYTYLPRRAPLWQVTYGASTYALALVAVMLSGMVARLPPGHLRRALATVVVLFLLGPTLFGSAAIVYALIQLGGLRPEDANGLWALGLWGLVSLLLALLARRMTAHI